MECTQEPTHIDKNRYRVLPKNSTQEHPHLHQICDHCILVAYYWGTHLSRIGSSHFLDMTINQFGGLRWPAWILPTIILPCHAYSIHILWQCLIYGYQIFFKIWTWWKYWTITLSYHDNRISCVLTRNCSHVIVSPLIEWRTCIVSLDLHILDLWYLSYPLSVNILVIGAKPTWQKPLIKQEIELQL